MITVLLLLVFAQVQDDSNLTLTMIDVTSGRTYTQTAGIYDAEKPGKLRRDPFTAISGSWEDTRPGVTVEAANRYFRGPDFIAEGITNTGTVTRVSGSWAGANAGLVAELVVYGPKGKGYAFTVTRVFSVDVSALNIPHSHRWFFRFYVLGQDGEQELAAPVEVSMSALRVEWRYTK